MTISLSRQFEKFKNWWLDFVTPIEARLWALLLRGSWASNQAARMLRKSKLKEQQFHGINPIEQIMRLENWRFALLCAATLIFLPQIVCLSGLIHLPEAVKSLFQDSASDQSTVASALTTGWQVLAAVISLTFVIVTILTQFAPERAFERLVFPLFVTHTWIIFTVIFGFLTLISMGAAALIFKNSAILQDNTPSVVFYNSILFLLNILLTLRLYLRTYQLMNRQNYQAIFVKYNRQQVLQSVDAELLKRKTGQLVIDACRKKGIEFSLWHSGSNPEIIGVDAIGLTNRVVEVVDVNLSLLALAHQRTKNLLGGKQFDRFKFIGLIQNRLSSERPEIAFIPKEADRPQITGLLQYVTKTRLMSDDQSEIEANLEMNRELISDAIIAKHSKNVKELLDLYFESLEAFLKSLEIHGFRISKQRATQEDRIFSDWKIVTAIEAHYYILIEQAIQSFDRETIYQFIHFLWKAMVLSIGAQDHLVFQRFANVFTRIYAVARRTISDESQRAYLYDSSWRSLVDFYTYHILLKLDNPKVTELEAISLGDYADYLIIVFNRLLKLSLDYRDLGQFRNYIGAIRRIGSWTGPSPIEAIASLQLRFQFAQDKAVRDQLESAIREKQTVVDQLIRLRRSRGVCFLGLGGWLTHLLESGAISSKDFCDYANSLTAEFIDIDALSSLYSAVLSDVGTGDSFEWHHWELGDRPESYGEIVVESMHMSDWIRIFYAYRALELSPLNLDAIPKLMPTSLSSQMVEMIERVIADFKTSPMWASIINGPSLQGFEQRALSFMEMLRIAARQQQSLEEDELIGLNIDQNTIQEFIATVERRWRETAILRNIIATTGRYTERAQAITPPDLLPLGIKQLDHKGAFVIQNRVQYSDWGSNYGRGLARGEDKNLSAELADLPIIESDIRDFDATITMALNVLGAANLKPVVLYNGIELHRAFYESRNFMPAWRSNEQPPNLIGLEGVYDGFWVVRVQSLTLNTLAVVDFEHFGVLTQYRTDDSEQFPLSISVQEITRDVAISLLNQQPELYVDLNTKKVIDQESAIRKLQQLVMVDVWEKCRFEEKNNMAGRCIVFPPPEQNDVMAVEAVPINASRAVQKEADRTVRGPMKHDSKSRRKAKTRKRSRRKL